MLSVRKGSPKYVHPNAKDFATVDAIVEPIPQLSLSDVLAARDKLRRREIPPAPCPLCGADCYASVDLHEGNVFGYIALDADGGPGEGTCPVCAAPLE